jgi:hypothetical protein
MANQEKAIRRLGDVGPGTAQTRSVYCPAAPNATGNLRDASGTHLGPVAIGSTDIRRSGYAGGISGSVSDPFHSDTERQLFRDGSDPIPRIARELIRDFVNDLGARDS